MTTRFSGLHAYTAAVVLILTFGGGARAAAPVIGLDEIEAGMTGYGLSVFEGTRVDTFGVTVVGVQENLRTAGNMILVEVSGHGLERSNIAQGMSGSPVFLDGRLAGALAFGWAGALRPLGGVTPAGEMLAVAADPPSAATGLVRGPVADWTELLTAPATDLSRDLGWADAVLPDEGPTFSWTTPENMARRLLTPLLGQEPSPSGWICRPSGTVLAVAAPATGAATGATLVPGGACAIPLIMGDAQLGAIGTVTWVDGADVWMMGHPFMQRGPVRLPLATAEILTLFPSRQMSFKMGSIGQVVGAVHQDRRPALTGQLGAVAPLLPVQVEVQEEGRIRTYSFEVADDPLLAAPLVFWAAYNSLLAEGNDASLQTVRWTVDLAWHSGSDTVSHHLVLKGAGAGPGGAASLGAGVMAPLNLLLANPFEPVSLDSVIIVMATEPGLATATVLGMTAPRRVPAGTTSLPVSVEIEPRRGPRRTLTMDLTLPAGLAAGRHRLIVASAAEFFALEAQRASGRFQLPDLAATVDLLAEERDQTTLVAALLVPGRNLVVRGRELSDLPGSVRQTVRRGTGAGHRTLADFVARREAPTDWLIQGHALLDLEIMPADQPLEPERRP